MKSKIEQNITSFFYDVCLPALKDKYSEFIIDFGLVGEDYDQVLVIELNEFMDTTDGMSNFLTCATKYHWAKNTRNFQTISDCFLGCMFNWSRERKQLEEGPFNFRIVEEPIPEEKQRGFLSPEWLEIVNSS